MNDIGDCHSEIYGDGYLEIRRYRAADHDAVCDLHVLALRQAVWDDDLDHIADVYLADRGEFLG